MNFWALAEHWQKFTSGHEVDMGRFDKVSERGSGHRNCIRSCGSKRIPMLFDGMGSVDTWSKSLDG